MARRLLFLYALLVFAGYGLFQLSMAASWLLLIRANDPAEVTKIADIVSKRDALASTTTVSFFDLKRELYSRLKPSIVAIGSSRSLQIRQSFFNESFFNFGGVAKALEHAFGFEDEVFRIHKPRILIFPIDYWALWDRNENFAIRPTKIQMPGKESINPILLPFRLFWEGRVSATQLWNLAKGNYPTKFGKIDIVGLNATLGPGGGFGSDGSAYQFSTVASNGSKKARARFLPEIECFASGSVCEPYYVDLEVDPRRIEMLRTFLKEMKDLDVHVVSYLAPLPPMVYSQMKIGPYGGNIQRLQSAMRAGLPEVHDFLDGSSVGSTDCEFLDAIHPSETTNLRMFRQIAERDVIFAKVLKNESADVALQSEGRVSLQLDEVSREFSNLVQDDEEHNRCVNE